MKKNNLIEKNDSVHKNDSLNVSLIEVFYVFLKIGTFTVGGGLAMLSLIEREVVDKKGWISKQEFVEQITIAQSGPGMIAANMAVFIGYKLHKIKGVIIAVLASVLPAFLIMLVISLYFNDIRSNRYMNSIFMGFRPAVAALIFTPVIRMIIRTKMSKKMFLVPVLAILLISYFNINPVWIIIVVVLGTLVYTKIKK